MQEGLNYGLTTSYINVPDQIHDMKMFKDKIFVVSNETALPWSKFYCYDWNNATVYHNGISTGILDIFINGNTAAFYRGKGEIYAGSSFSLFRDFTSDGITFGGSQGILQNLWGYTEISVVGESQIYGTKQYETLYNSQLDSYAARLPVYSISKTGTWGETLLCNSEYVIAKRYEFGRKRTIIAKRFGNVDRILLVGGKRNFGDGLHVTETDGTNVFIDKDIIDARVSNSVLITLGGLVGISNIYYLWLGIDIAKSINVNAPLTYFRYGNYLLFSEDFINWTVPISIGGDVFGGNLDNLNSGIISGGSLPFLFSILQNGMSANSRLDFNKGASVLDISDDIIDYSNQNNERVSITLGNFNGQ